MRVKRQRSAGRRNRYIGLQCFAIIDDCSAVGVALAAEGDEKGVRRRGARAGRIAWLRVKEQRGAGADENGDVAERRVEVCYRVPARGAPLHDGVGVPVTPDDQSAAGKETYFRGMKV